MNSKLALKVIQQLHPPKRYLVKTMRLSGAKYTLYDEERNPLTLIKLSLIESMEQAGLFRKVTVKKTGEKRLILNRGAIRKLHGKTTIKKGYKKLFDVVI